MRYTVYSQKHLFFEKFRCEFPVVTVFVLENLICLAII